MPITGCESLAVKGYNLSQEALNALMPLLQENFDFMRGLLQDTLFCGINDLEIHYYDDPTDAPGCDAISNCVGVGEYTYGTKSLKLNLTKDILDDLLAGSEAMTYAMTEWLSHELGHHVAGQLFDDSNTDTLAEFASHCWDPITTCSENQYDDYLHECWSRSADDSSDYWGNDESFSHGMDSLSEDWATTFSECLMAIRAAELCYNQDELDEAGVRFKYDPSELAKQKYEWMNQFLRTLASDEDASDRFYAYENSYGPPLDAADEPRDCQ